VDCKRNELQFATEISKKENTLQARSVYGNTMRLTIQTHIRVTGSRADNWILVAQNSKVTGFGENIYQI
jgi:hypothetical protein